MKIVAVLVSLLLNVTAHAGMLSVQTDGSTSGFGGEVRFFKIETELGKPHLFVLDTNDSACRIPLDMLKELGIDPLHFGLSLRNIRGNDGIVLTCFVTPEELGKRAFAHRIEITSWPRH